jgi:release factor glutamine methyltransferase
LSSVQFAEIEIGTRPGIVMTPRETSVALADHAVAHIGTRRCRVADVGTGSGAIAIAIAKQAPNAVVWATDCSLAAIELATRNAARAGVGARVVALKGDLLSPTAGRFDVIVANLPYLPAHERRSHPDLAGEPDSAVFADGDGCEPYRRLLREAPGRLNPGGIVVLQFRGRVLTAPRHRLSELEAMFLRCAA